MTTVNIRYCPIADDMTFACECFGCEFHKNEKCTYKEELKEFEEVVERNKRIGEELYSKQGGEENVD